jgi:hypothetical protein
MTLKFFKNARGDRVASNQEEGMTRDVLGGYITTSIYVNPSEPYRYYLLPYLYAALKYDNFDFSPEGNHTIAYIRGKVVTLQVNHYYEPNSPNYSLGVWELIRIIQYWDCFCRGELGEEFFLSRDLDFGIKKDEEGRWVKYTERYGWVRLDDDDLWEEDLKLRNFPSRLEDL